MKYKALRGTKDILPKEAALWQEIESVSRIIFRIFGYGEIRTPIIEETQLFIKSVGEDTDIVNKEMFSFTDRGERDIALRPEGTASIIRAYLESNLYKTAPFQRLYYMGPMFRAERPQAGRLRQFHQIGCEIIGSSNAAADAECVTLAARVLNACGISGYEIKLNNLGCREDKRKLSDLLKKTFQESGVQKQLCADCVRRSRANPMRLLDCKVESCRLIIRERFKKVDFLCDDCKAHFDSVIEYLNMLGIAFKTDPYIVRGLDYYTKTVFEITHPDLGSQSAIGAGGRYDDLVENMGGPSTGACGFALGTDRMIMVRGCADALTKEKALDVFVAALGDKALEKSFVVASSLRDSGIICVMDYENRSLKAQMRSADTLRAALVIIIGDDEITKNEVVIRDMDTKQQNNVPFDKLIAVTEDMLRQKGARQ